MTKDLYLMRHGQTLFNQQGRVQGACDSPLTELGVAQAQEARDFLLERGIQFGNLYSSTQERASDTLELVTGRTDYQRIKGVKEWNFGLFEAQPENLQPKHPETASFGEYLVPYGGESVDQVAERMVTSLTQIMKDNSDSSLPTLVLSHGGAMWAFYLRMGYLPNPSIRFSNCAICHYQYHETFELVEVIDPVQKTIYNCEKDDLVFW